MKKIPNQLNNKILTEIKLRLNPDLKFLLLKLFSIHLITALVTLSICPQFGLSVFKSNFNLMDTFMKIGPHFCDFACGAFFTTTSMISALIVLSRDEARVLRHKKFLASFTVILASLGFLLMLNPQLFVEFSILWLLGSIGGVVLSLELGTRVLKFS
ncbi:MAG: hypothetical protein H7281_07155 [Bacteriovorax sp.]|nr:hypothetical protein [Bacteriovorax sp.]